MYPPRTSTSHRGAVAANRVITVLLLRTANLTKEKKKRVKQDLAIKKHK